MAFGQGGRPGGGGGGGRMGGGGSSGGRGGPRGRQRATGTRNQNAARVRTNQRKPSYLEEHRISFIDYKDTKLLAKFLNPQSKILPRRITRLTNIQHRALTKAVKRARHLALLPFVMDAEAY